MTWPPAGVTPYYCDEWCCIIHADCREVLPRLAPVDLVLTDPPYGVHKAAWDTTFAMDWLPLIADKTPVCGVMPGIRNLLTYPQQIGPLRYRWTLAAHVVNGMTHGAFGYGNWIACLVYATEGTVLAQGASDICGVAIGNEPKPAHPSPKPYAAMRWMLHRLPGRVILDPFAGSGTTLHAAKDLGRRAIGIEISAAYCAIAARRLTQEVLPLRYKEPPPCP